MEINVYIANLGKYNEGELVGAWFTLPACEDEIAEKIGLNEHYEEYAIHDYEAPFEIGEYDSLSTLNEIAELFDDHYNDVAIEYVGEIADYLGIGIVEVFDKINDIIVYSECQSWADYARYFIDECGYLDGLPALIANNIDYEGVGVELCINGSGCFQASDGTIIYCW